MAADETLASHITRVINKLIFLEKKSIVEVDGVKLFPSEVHLLEVIVQDPTINALGMARKLGISKGAVSQTLTRLDKKGIIFKVKDPANKNEITAHFTGLGKKAVAQHDSMRASLQKEYEHYLRNLAKGERKVIHNFLAHVEGFIDRLR